MSTNKIEKDKDLQNWQKWERNEDIGIQKERREYTGKHKKTEEI